MKKSGGMKDSNPEQIKCCRSGLVFRYRRPKEKRKENWENSVPRTRSPSRRGKTFTPDSLASSWKEPEGEREGGQSERVLSLKEFTMVLSKCLQARGASEERTYSGKRNIREKGGSRKENSGKGT